MLRVKFAVIISLFSVSLFGQHLENFKSSLHFTRAGKNYWYSNEQGGFESLTGIPITNLSCNKCHMRTSANGSPIDAKNYTPSCTDCHTSTETYEVNHDQCIRCHSHQRAEMDLYDDVHRTAGFKCMDCHTSRDVHGTGEHENSIYDNAVERNCESCHQKISDIKSHTVHGNKISCSSCHMQSQVSCFTCHFETGNSNTRLGGYILLAKDKRTGIIKPANFMALTYKDKSFYTIGPYYSHTITKAGRMCKDCHRTKLLKEYKTSGKILMTKWDGGSKQIVNTKGVIPVPNDWEKSFIFDFIDYNKDEKNWSYLKTGADKTQMMYVEPLDQITIDKLSPSK